MQWQNSVHLNSLDWTLYFFNSSSLSHHPQEVIHKLMTPHACINTVLWVHQPPNAILRNTELSPLVQLRLNFLLLSSPLSHHSEDVMHKLVTPQLPMRQKWEIILSKRYFKWKQLWITDTIKCLIKPKMFNKIPHPVPARDHRTTFGHSELHCGTIERVIFSLQTKWTYRDHVYPVKGIDNATAKNDNSENCAVNSNISCTWAPGVINCKIGRISLPTDAYRSKWLYTGISQYLCKHTHYIDVRLWMQTVFIQVCMSICMHIFTCIGLNLCTAVDVYGWLFAAPGRKRHLKFKF